MEKPIKKKTVSTDESKAQKEIGRLTKDLAKNQNILAQLQRSMQIVTNTIVGQRYTLDVLNAMLSGKDGEKSKETPL